MCEAFIFDMDGVIIDSEPLHFEVDRLTMKHFGVDISAEELEEYVGMTNPEMWARLKIKYGLTETVEEIIAFQLNRKIAALDESDAEPIEGVVELLEELRTNRIKTGLASSSPRRFIEAVIGKFGIERCFGCLVSGEEVAQGKPAPDVFLEAARQLGANPSQCIVLEDSRNGRGQSRRNEVHRVSKCQFRESGFVQGRSDCKFFKRDPHGPLRMILRMGRGAFATNSLCMV